MAMSLTVLENELKALALYDTEAAAVTAWADAFAAYFEGDGSTQGAESSAVYVASAAMPAAKADMASALAGMSGAGAGAAKIAAGITDFWASLVAAVPPNDPWPTVTLITPPPALAGLAAALQATFTANKNGNKSKDDAMDAIAANINTACIGGTATWPGPTVLPIT